MLENLRVLEWLPSEWAAGYAADNGDAIVTGGFPEEPEVLLRVLACRCQGWNYRAALAGLLAQLLATATEGEYVQVTADLLWEMDDLPPSAALRRRGGFPNYWRTESMAGTGSVRVVAGIADDPRGLVVVESAQHGNTSYVHDLALLLAECLRRIAAARYVR
ncbi:hypothetical protein SAMN05421805_103152 [Saccharopolyspora antimicrobica]|uniref:Uncharacterized protein n=1 Tax=Saccharopolyspora antimicrobica TaxID=455193 RepID=A0A1I4X0K8_9PSEU|nr:hypothetical protein [Saccharopolyspora antimicrobica]RKT84226.1 hypothetical protein ATL45_2536 [Saccharopolyspora antimicrobica]SFN18910.1 hypothetical protein SAMN05421805_103152 [Saccharopolyspora antimicrobica]